MTGLTDRRKVEKQVLQMIVTFSALCNAEFILLPEPGDLERLNDPDADLSWGYEFVGKSKFYDFGIELIVSNQTRIRRKYRDNIDARLFVAIYLPDAISKIFERHFGNSNFEGVTFQLNALMEMDFGAHDPDWLWACVHQDIGELEFDSMTDTMLRAGYKEVAAELEPLLPWLEFAQYCASEANSWQQLERLQKDFMVVLAYVLQAPTFPTEKLFTLCEVANSFEPAVHLINRRQAELQSVPAENIHV